MLTSVCEVSTSLGVPMFCNANIVDDGGVFSPRIGLNEGLERLKLGVSPPFALFAGVEAPDLVGLLTDDRSLLLDSDARENRSGDLSGDLSGDFSGDRSSELNTSV